MATKSAGEFRNGMTLEIDGKVCQVMEFMHVKPGKGAAFVRVKLKDIINGGVVETTFRPTESFQEAFIERKKMQYLYNDGDLYYFMDNETFDQIAIEPPLTVELQVTETEPGFKGNTAQGATKPAIVETGAQVSVPLFVDQGEMIKIDTRTGEYLSRV